MGIADELQKLDELRRDGTLTDDEFAKAKTRLLESPPPVVNVGLAASSPLVEEQLTEVRLQNELARVDREWEIERRKYEIVGRRGRVFVPTVGAGISTAVVGGLFGVFWIWLSLTIAGPVVSYGFDGPWMIKATHILPLIGLLITIMSVTRGLYYCLVAVNHNSAFATYRARRAKLTKE